MCLNSIL